MTIENPEIHHDYNHEIMMLGRELSHSKDVLQAGQVLSKIGTYIEHAADIEALEATHAMLEKYSASFNVKPFLEKITYRKSELGAEKHTA